MSLNEAEINKLFLQKHNSIQKESKSHFYYSSTSTVGGGGGGGGGDGRTRFAWSDRQEQEMKSIYNKTDWTLPLRLSRSSSFFLFIIFYCGSDQLRN